MKSQLTICGERGLFIASWDSRKSRSFDSELLANPTLGPSSLRARKGLTLQARLSHWAVFSFQSHDRFCFLRATSCDSDDPDNRSSTVNFDGVAESGPVNRLQATREPRRVMPGGTQRCALGSEGTKADPRAVLEKGRGKLSLPPKEQSVPEWIREAMSNPDYSQYLQSDHWQWLKLTKVKQVGRACQSCRQTSNLHGHHVRYKALFDCTTEDILILCDNCHDCLHAFSKSTGISLLGVGLSECKSMIRSCVSKVQSESSKDKARHKANRLSAIQAMGICKQKGCSRESIIELVNALQRLL